jgi:hypothetical protein
VGKDIESKDELTEDHPAYATLKQHFDVLESIERKKHEKDVERRASAPSIEELERPPPTAYEQCFKELYEMAKSTMV